MMPSMSPVPNALVMASIVCWIRAGALFYRLAVQACPSHCASTGVSAMWLA